MEKTKQTKCAYCGLDIAGVYEYWLNMAIDHVVPVSVCQELQISRQWRDDYCNCVLSCAACNGLGNRYRPKNPVSPKTIEEFYKLRDDIFEERRKLILEKRAKERTFYQDKIVGRLTGF